MPGDLYGGAADSDGTYVYVAGGYSFTSRHAEHAVQVRPGSRHVDDDGTDARPR